MIVLHEPEEITMLTAVCGATCAPAGGFDEMTLLSGWLLSHCDVCVPIVNCADVNNPPTADVGWPTTFGTATVVGVAGIVNVTIEPFAAFVFASGI